MTPCPFCGHATLRQKGTQVECINCGAEGPSSLGSVRAPLELWDARQPDARTAALVRAAQCVSEHLKFSDFDSDAVIMALRAALQPFERAAEEGEKNDG